MLNKTKTILLVLLSVIAFSFVQIIFKLASETFSISINLIFNYYLLVAIGLCAVGGTTFLLALKRGELSLVYPTTALSYVIVGLLSFSFLNEIISFQKGVGLAIITFGVIFVGMGGKNE